MTSKIVKTNLPCPCGKSSDAYALYDDGHGYCFSGYCENPLHNNKQEEPLTETETPRTFEYLPWRGLTKETMAFFEMSTAIDVEGKPVEVGIKFPNGSVQVRGWDTKTFKTIGDIDKRQTPQLFFADRFAPGCAKSITLTEGAVDAASVYQMIGAPAVSVKSASSARRDAAAYQKYLDSFERIYLCLDDDEPGRKAAKEVAELFDFNKVFYIHLGELKDANAFLQGGREKEFKQMWANAKKYLPAGIISGHDAFSKVLAEAKDRPALSYPHPTLDEVTRGIRMGEFILVTAMEGIGKTEFFRSIEYHLLTTTGLSIGTIHLEESTDRQLKGLASYDLNLPAHFEGNATNEEVTAALKRITKDSDDRLHIYNHPDVDDPDALLDAVRYLVTVLGCKVIFLDHLSQLVSGLQEEDERKLLDYISTKLARMVKNLDFTLFAISHVNDAGQTRGSRYIGKVANTRIDLSRNKLHEDPAERNKLYTMVEKNRFGSTTGPGGILAFDPMTFKLAEYVPPIVPVPEV